jgi:hypothetical protein
LPKNILTYGAGGNDDTAAGALTSTANFLKGAMAGVRVQEIGPANPILQLSRHGMLLRSIGGPSRLLALGLWRPIEPTDSEMQLPNTP